jgi:hypothetical protein
MKKCSKCLHIKPFDDFIKNKSRSDGLSSYCKVCNREYKKLQYANNPAPQKQQSKNYRNNNPEKIRLLNEAYWGANKEQLKVSNSKRFQENKSKYKKTRLIWVANNKHVLKELEMRRRARLKNNPSFEIRKSFLAKLYSSPCAFCGSNKNIQMDHVIPVSKGGTHGEGNLQPLCGSCNSSKGNRLWVEWKYAK